MDPLVYIIQSPPSWLKTPPLSLIYLMTYLRHKGIAVKIFDLNIACFKHLQPSLNHWLTLNKQFEDSLFDFILKQHPGCFDEVFEGLSSAHTIGFSIGKRNANFSFLLADNIKKRFPEKKIVFGGPETLSLHNENKLHGDYYWVIGEGETSFSQIIAGGKKKIYTFEEIENIDTLPFYSFEPLQPFDYSRTLPLLSSRGCPYQCRFCSEKLLYNQFRHHCAGYVLEQIKYLLQLYRTRNFVFLDSLINYDHEWLEEFCCGLIKEKLAINWEAQMRIQDNFPPALAKLMKDSGCYNLFIGLESGSDRILASMNKGFNIGSAVQFLTTLKRANLHFEVSLIFGYPGEEERDFRKTLDFIVKHKTTIPKIAQVNPFVDYLHTVPKEALVATRTHERIELFVNTLKKENIRYTKSFINNLTY